MYGKLVDDTKYEGNDQLYTFPLNPEHEARFRKIYGVEGTIVCKLSGTAIGSDINWNNFQGRFYVGTAHDKAIFYARIMPFVKNCGAKAISHLHFIMGLTEDVSPYLQMLEYALYDRCNAGLIVGSDFTAGGTYNYIKKWGKNYIFSDVIPNPTYGKPTNNHKIGLFYKLQEGLNPPNGMSRIS